MAKKTNPTSFTPPDLEESKTLTHQEANRLLQAERINDIRSIAKTPEGLRFFQEMMLDCGLLSEAFDGNSKDFYKAGRRSIALKYINLIGIASPDLQSAIINPRRIPYTLSEEEYQRIEDMASNGNFE